VLCFLKVERIEAFFIHYKINNIKAFAVGFAVGRKAINGIRFFVNLHAWGFVAVEGAVYAVVAVHLVVIVVQYLGDA